MSSKPLHATTPLEFGHISFIAKLHAFVNMAKCHSIDRTLSPGSLPLGSLQVVCFHVRGLNEGARDVMHLAWGLLTLA